MAEFRFDWCPTKKMVADFMTKPLQCSNFRDLRDYIIGRVRLHQSFCDQSGPEGQDKKLIKKSKVNGNRCITVTGSKCRIKVMAQ
jgi:hypothetical protein